MIDKILDFYLRDSTLIGFVTGWFSTVTNPAGVVRARLVQCGAKIIPSNRVGGAEDRIVDSHIVGQVGHVVAFALAVGVVLHAVERKVVQAHLIVAIAHQHLGDGSRHELGDGGGGRQLRGGRGGQQGDGAGGEGIEVFSVNHGVDAAAQFDQVFVGLQN